MRHNLLTKFPVLGVSLLLAGSLIAYVYSADDPSGPTLSREGLMTAQTRGIVSGNDVYLLGPVETITDMTHLESVTPSSDGSAALIVINKGRPYHRIALSQTEVDPYTQGNFPEVDIVHWDLRTRTTKTIFRGAASADTVSSVVDVQWLPQTRIALVLLSHFSMKTQTSTYDVMRVDATAGTIRRVTGMDSGDPVAIRVSPDHPLAYIVIPAIKGENGQPDIPRTLRVYTPQGLRSPIYLDDAIVGLQWSLDGKSLYSTTLYEKTADGKRTRRKALTLIELETGRITHPETLPTFQTNEAKSATTHEWSVRVTSTKPPLSAPGGASQNVNALWLQAATEPAAQAANQAGQATSMPGASKGTFASVFTEALLIATNAKSEGFLANPDTAAVLFSRDGALCAAPVFRLPQATFAQALLGMQRQTTLQNAKQVGLGILQYTQDYDETFPMPGSSVAKVLDPYTRSETVFQNPATGSNGFVYTYKGATALSQVESPATTQLGYVSGPGGKAIIWADGHVTWQDGM